MKPNNKTILLVTAPVVIICIIIFLYKPDAEASPSSLISSDEHTHSEVADHSNSTPPPRNTGSGDALAPLQPLYENFSWEIMNRDADWIVKAKVIEHIERYVSVPDFSRDIDLYSNRFQIELTQTFKSPDEVKLLDISVLEDAFYNVQPGDELLLFLVESKPGNIVPMGKEHGIFTITDGQATGYFMNQAHLEISRIADEKTGARSIPLDKLVSDIEALQHSGK